MKKIIFKGCGTAIATPFTENGVNLQEFQKLVEEQIKEGVDSIIVCGTTGESATMTEEERLQTIECAVKTAKSSKEKPEYLHVCKAGPVFFATDVEI